MTVTDLYEAYESGKITRGAFIRRLVGLGMTLPVATAYAASLARSEVARATDGQPADLYPDLYDLGPDLYGQDLYDLYGDLYPPGV